MKSESYFIFVCDNYLKFGSLFSTMMKDLNSVSNCECIYDMFSFCDGLLSKIYRKLNNIVPEKNWSLLFPFELDNIIKRIAFQYSNIEIIFFNAVLVNYHVEKIKEYKYLYRNVNLNLCFVDASTLGSAIVATDVAQNYRSLFSHIFSNNPVDCKKYGWEFLYTPYSVLDALEIEKPVLDLFWGGHSKRREKILASILEKCDMQNIKWGIELSSNEIDSDLKKFVSSDEFIFRKPSEMVSYEKMLKSTLRSRCILDIVVDQEQPLTIRTYEAVCYNRKLLTNNRQILNFPYYDENFMQFFEEVSDIDFNWIKEEKRVDYSYSNDFSPLALLKLL